MLCVCVGVRRESFVPDVLPEQRRPSDEAVKEGGKCVGHI